LLEEPGKADTKIADLVLASAFPSSDYVLSGRAALDHRRGVNSFSLLDWSVSFESAANGSTTSPFGE